MMNTARRALNFIEYYVKGSNRHDLHSPFLYQLNEVVIRKDKCLPEHYAFEKVRSELKKSKRIILTEDYGAGSSYGNQTGRKLSEIVRRSSKSPHYARLLYRLVNYLQPKRMLELGTAAGISALYQAGAYPNGKLITLEGNRELAAVARDVLRGTSAEVITGRFEDTLEQVLHSYAPFQYVFLDGNHQKEPLLQYFRQVLPTLDQEAVIVIDDINWSEEMQSAWKELKADPGIQVSVDLFQLGLLFKRPGLSRQEFTIRY